MKTTIKFKIIKYIIFSAVILITSCGGKQKNSNPNSSSATEYQVEKVSCEYCGKSVPKNQAIFDDVRYNYFCSNDHYKSWLFQNSN